MTLPLWASVSSSGKWVKAINAPEIPHRECTVHGQVACSAPCTVAATTMRHVKSNWQQAGQEERTEDREQPRVDKKPRQGSWGACEPGLILRHHPEGLRRGPPGLVTPGSARQSSGFRLTGAQWHRHSWGPPHPGLAKPRSPCPGFAAKSVGPSLLQDKAQTGLRAWTWGGSQCQC